MHFIEIQKHTYIGINIQYMRYACIREQDLVATQRRHPILQSPNRRM